MFSRAFLVVDCGAEQTSGSITQLGFTKGWYNFLRATLSINKGHVLRDNPNIIIEL